MSEAIIESRPVPIALKVLTQEDVTNIALILWNAVEDLKSKDKVPLITKVNNGGELVEEFNYNLVYKIVCDDNRILSSSHFSIFEKNEDRVKSLFMEMKCLDYGITVEIKHGCENDSYYCVSGIDEQWINWVDKKLEKTIKNVKDQQTAFYSNKKLLNILLPILGIMLFGSFVDIYFYYQNSNYTSVFRDTINNYFGSSGNIRYGIGQTIVGLVFGLPLGALMQSYLEKQVHRNWPFIEIQLGAEHLHIEKKRRATLIHLGYNHFPNNINANLSCIDLVTRP